MLFLANWPTCLLGPTALGAFGAIAQSLAQLLWHLHDRAAHLLGRPIAALNLLCAPPAHLICPVALRRQCRVCAASVSVCDDFCIVHKRLTDNRLAPARLASRTLDFHAQWPLYLKEVLGQYLRAAQNKPA